MYKDLCQPGLRSKNKHSRNEHQRSNTEMEEKQVKAWILYLIYNFDKKNVYIFTQFNTSLWRAVLQFMHI